MISTSALCRHHLLSMISIIIIIIMISTSASCRHHLLSMSIINDHLQHHDERTPTTACELIRSTSAEGVPRRLYECTVVPNPHDMSRLTCRVGQSMDGRACVWMVSSLACGLEASYHSTVMSRCGAVVVHLLLHLLLRMRFSSVSLPICLSAPSSS